jgi:hypothetical protein
MAIPMGSMFTSLISDKGNTRRNIPCVTHHLAFVLLLGVVNIAKSAARFYHCTTKLREQFFQSQTAI